MGIRVGGGKGFVNVGGGEGLQIGRRPVQKPVEPVQNPFPEKGKFRLGVYELVEEKDDYLICRGYDPNRERASRYSHSGAEATIHVAKPPLLQRTLWDGQTVNLIVNGVSTPVTFSYTGIGVRTATAIVDEQEVTEIQRITMDYIPGDAIIAVQVRKSAAVDGIDTETEVGGRVSWVDLNVSGRCWAVALGEDG